MESPPDTGTLLVLFTDKGRNALHRSVPFSTLPYFVYVAALFACLLLAGFCNAYVLGKDKFDGILWLLLLTP